MPVTVIATAGAADANSYATVAEADTFHANRLYSDAWDGADGDDQKGQALIMATQLLDQWFTWDGEVASSDQALLWPRAGVVGPNGFLVDSTTIPDRIRDGTAELAKLLLSSDLTAAKDQDTEGLKSLKAGSVELVFKGEISTFQTPDSVTGFVGVFGKRGGSSDTVTLLRA